jgi:hypothetical protein
LALCCLNALPVILESKNSIQLVKVTTSSKIILLACLYGLPFPIAKVYRIKENMETKRITENDVRDILGTEIPEINDELHSMPCSNAYNSLEYLAKFTRECAVTGNMVKLKDCFWVAETLLSKGNSFVKSAVENVYVFSISSLIEITSPIQNQITKMLTSNLKISWQKQTMAKYP